MEEQIVEAAKSIIKEDYSEIEFVEEIADKIDCSYDYLRYYFVRKTGYCLCEYLNKTKCEKAATLLKKTNWKLYRIAREIGFRDDKYLIKVFKKYYNMSPGKYRIDLTKRLKNPN